jgi:hypothetical protein
MTEGRLEMAGARADCARLRQLLGGARKFSCGGSKNLGEESAGVGRRERKEK